jgi:transglutaminase-like putative cysteine protease
MPIEWSERASYSFSESVPGLALELRMNCLPALGRTASVDTVIVSPEPSARHATHDIFGNKVIELRFDRPVRRLVFSGFHRVPCGPVEPVPTSFLPLDLVLEEGGQAPTPTDGATPQAIATILEGARRGWRFDASVTGLDRSLADIRSTRRGVCQDLARLVVDLFRRRGMPARFAVGYAVPRESQAPLLRHAWIAVYVAGAWRELDPANLREEPRQRVATAWGSALASIGPVVGRTPVKARTQLSLSALARVEDEATDPPRAAAARRC